MTWEYKTIRLARENTSQTWAEEADSYSQQLSQAAEGGWEITHIEIP